MTTGTQQLRDFSDWLDRRYPASVSMGVRAAADYIDAQAAEIERLRKALIDAAAHMSGAASAYRRHAMRHNGFRPKAVPDALFSTRAGDFDAAAQRARAALSGESNAS